MAPQVALPPPASAAAGRRGSKPPLLLAGLSARGEAADTSLLPSVTGTAIGGDAGGAGDAGGGAVDAEAAAVAPPLSPEEEREALIRRVLRSEELIRQLKHIVKAQHVKIEELRQRLDIAPTSVRSFMVEQDLETLAKARKESEEYRVTVNSMKADLIKLKTDNETLRKANRRFRGLLEQQEPQQQPSSAAAGAAAWPCRPMSTSLMSDAGPSVFDEEVSLTEFSGERTMLPADVVGTARRTRILDPADFGATGRETSPLRASFGLSAPLMSTATSPPASSSRRSPTTTRVAKSGPLAGMPLFTRLSRLMSALPILWKDLESPCAVLGALGDVALRVISDLPGTTLTVYALDPWLRAAAEAELDGPATVYYLGQGKTQLQVVGNRLKQEPPCFPGLQALPYFTRTAVAVAVHLRDRQFAVLQVSCSNGKLDDASLRGQTNVSGEASAPRVLREIAPAKDEDRRDCQEPPGFTETALGYLQLISGVAGGMLAQIERLKGRQTVIDRMRLCMEVAVEVNKARSLLDLEQRVKVNMGTFFDVTSVRLLFHDPEHRCLLQSSAVRRQDPTAFSLDRGIIGMVARKMQVMHLSSISQSPHVDSAADGLIRSGRQMAPNTAMLVGPLCVDAEGGAQQAPRLIGVVQLLERRRKAPGSQAAASGKGSGASNDFTIEEQAQFQQLLRICTYAAWRTWKVQEQAAQLAGSPSSLARLIGGK